MRILTLCSLGTLLALSATAQRSGVAAKPPAPTRNAGPAVSAPLGLTADEGVVIARLRKEDKAFDLSPDEMIRLKKANVSDATLEVMLDPKAEIKPAAPLSEPPSPPAAAAGTTPSAGAAAVGDPNDPMAPHESGIYLYTKDRDGKVAMTVLELAAAQGQKVRAGPGSFVGWPNGKIKEVIPGQRASIRTSDANPEFYFYFDDKAAGLGQGVTVSNPNQYALLKLDLSKSNRETNIGKFGVFGSSSGADPNAIIGFKSQRIRPGLYKVTMGAPLQPGEYCFLSGGAGAVGVFDFGVDQN